MKCIFIYNPKSGKGKVFKKLDYIKQELQKKYEIVDVHETTSQQDTIDTAKYSCDKYDAIIFAGGDGTFNDITCGIAEMPNRPTLGYIPTGTVNDIARNLGISKNIKKAIQAIVDNQYVTHDVGMINNTYFMYVAALGTFAATSFRTKHKYKKVLGKFAYLLDGLQELINPATIKTKVTTADGEVYESTATLLLVMNSISAGGVPFNKDGHMNDGKFDIVIVKKYLGSGIIGIANTVLIGVRRKRITKFYQLIRSSEFKIEVDNDINWAIDGEEGMKGSVVIKNLHDHIKIYVPFKNGKPLSKHLKI
jgi:diacylglycerol kinase (ATP)